MGRRTEGSTPHLRRSDITDQHRQQRERIVCVRLTDLVFCGISFVQNSTARTDGTAIGDKPLLLINYLEDSAPESRVCLNSLGGCGVVDTAVNLSRCPSYV